MLLHLLFYAGFLMCVHSEYVCAGGLLMDDELMLGDQNPMNPLSPGYHHVTKSYKNNPVIFYTQEGSHIDVRSHKVIFTDPTGKQTITHKEKHFLLLNGQNITGPLPANIDHLPHMQYLFLDQNLITGDLPESLGNMQDLRHINFNDNRITSFPGDIFQETPHGSAARRIELQISNNPLDQVSFNPQISWIVHDPLTFNGANFYHISDLYRCKPAFFEYCTLKGGINFGGELSPYLRGYGVTHNTQIYPPTAVHTQWRIDKLDTEYDKDELIGALDTVRRIDIRQVRQQRIKSART